MFFQNRKLESELLRLQRQQHGRSLDNCHQDVAQVTTSGHFGNVVEVVEVVVFISTVYNINLSV